MFFVFVFVNLLTHEKNKNKTKSKKESILDLSRFMNKEVHVKFAGGREGKKPKTKQKTKRLKILRGFVCYLKKNKKFHTVYNLHMYIVYGRLFGFDAIVNLVLDQCYEYIRGKKNTHKIFYICRISNSVS